MVSDDDRPPRLNLGERVPGAVELNEESGLHRLAEAALDRADWVERQRKKTDDPLQRWEMASEIEAELWAAWRAWDVERDEAKREKIALTRRYEIEHERMQRADVRLDEIWKALRKAEAVRQDAEKVVKKPELKGGADG